MSSLSVRNSEQEKVVSFLRNLGPGKDRLCLLLVGMVAVFHMAVNSFWLAKDSFPLWFDYGGYFTRSIEMFYAAGKGPLEFFAAVFGTGRYAYSFLPYRFFLPVSSLPWYYVFGLTPDTAVMSCSLFLFVALFATYDAARNLFDRQTGVLAACILSFSPGFFVFSRLYAPEFAAMALSGLAVMFLIRSKGFLRPAPSALFGIVFASAILTKELAVVSVAGALSFVLLMIFVDPPQHAAERNSRRQRMIIAGTALGISCAFVLAVYMPHRSLIAHEIFNVALSEEVRKSYGMVPPYSLSGLVFYARGMATSTFGPANSLFFIIGLIACIRRRCAGRMLLFFWIAGGYVLLCLPRTRAEYYALPLLVPLAIVAAFGCRSLFERRIKRMLVSALVIVCGLLGLFILTFPVGTVPQWRIVSWLGSALGGAQYPRQENWKLEEIVGYLSQHKPAGARKATVHCGANLYGLSPQTLEYTAALVNAGLAFSGYTLELPRILQEDFVIIKTGSEQGIFYSASQSEALVTQVEQSGLFVRLPRTFSLPDGSQAVVYRRTGQDSGD